MRQQVASRPLHARRCCVAPAEPLSGLFHAPASPLAFCCTRSAACNSRTAFRPLPRASKSPCPLLHASRPLSSDRTAFQPLPRVSKSPCFRDMRQSSPRAAHETAHHYQLCPFTQRSRSTCTRSLARPAAQSKQPHRARPRSAHRREDDVLVFTKARRLSSYHVLPQ